MNSYNSRFTKRADETRVFSVSLAGKLLGAELLNGTPTVIEVDTSGLTIANVSLNTVTRTALPSACGPPSSVPLVSQTVQFTASGGVRGSAYTVRIVVTTDGSPSQILTEEIRIQVQ